MSLKAGDNLKIRNIIIISIIVVIITGLVVLGFWLFKGDSSAEDLPVSGGTLKLYSYAPDTLNPILTENAANRMLLNLVYEPLIWCDNSNSAVPCLATDWDVSASGLAWTITLREGVAFHDSSILTANDVVWSINEARKSESPYSQTLRNVVNVMAVDQNSVMITLNKLQINFINSLEIPIMKSNSGSIPNGTGPYRYISQATNKYIEFDANVNYWGGMPYIQKIEALLMPDRSTASFSFEAKEIDVITTDFSNLGIYLGSSENRIIPFCNSLYNFLGIDHTNKQLAKKEIRQALAMSIDKNKLSSELLFSQGTITSTFSNPTWVMSAGVSDYEYSLSSSKDLLKKAGYGQEYFTLIVNKDNEFRCMIADFCASAAKDANIRIQVKKLSWEQYKEAIINRDYDLYIGECLVPNDADPSFLFSSSITNYSNPSMETALANLRNASTQDAVKQKYAELEALYIEELPFISLYFDSTALLVNNKVKGELVPLKNNIYYKIEKWYLSQ